MLKEVLILLIKSLELPRSLREIQLLLFILPCDNLLVLFRRTVCSFDHGVDFIAQRSNFFIFKLVHLLSKMEFLSANKNIFLQLSHLLFELVNLGLFL